MSSGSSGEHSGDQSAAANSASTTSSGQSKSGSGSGEILKRVDKSNPNHPLVRVIKMEQAVDIPKSETGGGAVEIPEKIVPLATPSNPDPTTTQLPTKESSENMLIPPTADPGGGETKSTGEAKIESEPPIGKKISNVDEPKKPPKDAADDLDEQKKKVGFKSLFGYPRGAYFCLGNISTERFAYYGMTSILALYFRFVFEFDETKIKLIFHGFSSTVYFAPIIGSILADGFLGRYRVILFGSIICCVGHVLMTVGAVSTLGNSAMLGLTFLGLFTIAIATGGIKPCTSAFAADQFPKGREAERDQFFSFFYFMVNFGALLSKIITPMLRAQPCMDQKTCFPLAFGVPAAFMLLSLTLFALGTRWYKIAEKSGENVLIKVCKCIICAVRMRRSSPVKKAHWLEHAIPYYDAELVDDIKTMFSIMLLFLPVVFFWALFDQQGSTWILQGSQMEGRVGQLTILPDQMGVLNPLLVIILLPIFEGFLYPFLAKFNIWTRPLRRMGWGGVLAVASFVVAGILQLFVDKTAVKMPEDDKAHLYVANLARTNVTVGDHSGDRFVVGEGEIKNGTLATPLAIFNLFDGANSMGQFNLTMEPKQKEGDKKYVQGYVVGVFDGQEPPWLPFLTFKLEKTKEGMSKIYFLFEPSDDGGNQTITVEKDGEVSGTVQYKKSVGEFNNVSQSGFVEISPKVFGTNRYEIFSKKCDGCVKKRLGTFTAETAAARVYIIRAKETIRSFEVINPNRVSMLWQIPQYILITVGEILFSVSGLAFSYTQASPKMKSVFQAIWLLTVAFGNLIAMGLSGSGMFEGLPAVELFVYACLMGVVTLLFVFIAWRYKFKKTAETK